MTDRPNTITVQYSDEADRLAKIAQHEADNWYLHETANYDTGDFLTFGGPDKYHTWNSTTDVWEFDENLEVKDIWLKRMPKVLEVAITWMVKRLNELRALHGEPPLTKSVVMRQLKEEWKNL